MFTGIAPNTEKEAGLEHLIRMRVGGAEAYENLTEDQFNQHKRAVIHDLNNLQGSEMKHNNERLDYQARANEVELGTSAYGSAAGGRRSKSPYASIAYANGQDFLWNGKAGFPTYVGESQLAGAEATQMAIQAADYMDIAIHNPTWDEDQILVEQGKMEIAMRESKDRMAIALKSEGRNPKQADNYYEAMIQMRSHQNIDPTNFGINSGGRDLKGDTKPMGTGMQGDGIRTSTGYIEEGQPGYADAFQIKTARDSRVKAEEKTRIATDRINDNEALTMELQTERHMTKFEELERISGKPITDDDRVKFTKIVSEHPEREFDELMETMLNPGRHPLKPRGAVGGFGFGTD